MTSEFDRDTAVEARGGGSYGAHLSPNWWVQSGPNGGYLAALLLRAMLAEVDDAQRAARTLHVRFLKPPAEGPCTIQLSTLQQGRSMTTLAASLRQGDRELVVASAAFSGPFSTIAFQDSGMPDLPALTSCTPIDKRIALNQRWDMYKGLGGELRKSPRALTGGYIRLAEERQPDVLTLAAVWDAWPPAMFARAIEQRFRGAVPTVEVSLHFRGDVAGQALTGRDYLVLHTESDAAFDGFTEEVTHIWSPDGVLLARARQVAVLLA